MFGAISEKFRTFDIQIIFAIPPISHFSRWLGESFSLFKVTKFLSLYQSVRQESRKLFRHFTTVPIYTLDRFLEFTQDHAKTLDFPETTIENVKNILQESTAFEIGSSAKMDTTNQYSKKESGNKTEQTSLSDEPKAKSEPIKSK